MHGVWLPVVLDVFRAESAEHINTLMGAERFLAKLTEALIRAAEYDPPKTDAFASAMDCIVPVFDHLGTFLFLSRLRYNSLSIFSFDFVGPVLQFAKADLISKVLSQTSMCSLDVLPMHSAVSSLWVNALLRGIA